MSQKTLLVASVIFFFLFLIATSSSNSFSNVISVLFIGGIWGLIAITKKGYVTGVSIALWLLFGWWFILALLFGGPFTLFIAALLPDRKRCIHCKSYIPKNATRCPKCAGSLTASAQKYRVESDEKYQV